MVDPKDTAQMAKFMMMTNEINAFTEGLAASPSTYIAPPALSAVSAVSADSVNEMKSILSKFYIASGNVVSEASFDRPLRESLVTEPIPAGARIGNWEIMVEETEKRKFYSITHVTTKQVLAADLLLYDAAHYLVKHLNEGGRINAPEILDILNAEQSYAAAIHDMRLYKYHLTKHPNSPKKSIYEDRYTDAKRKAIALREKVEKLADI